MVNMKCVVRFIKCITAHPLAIGFVTCDGFSLQRKEKDDDGRPRLDSSHLIQAVSSYHAPNEVFGREQLLKYFLSIVFVFWFGISLCHAKVVERVEAVVNDKAILLSDVKEFDRNFKTGVLVFEELLQIRDRDKLKKDWREKIRYLIDEKIIDFEVQRKNFQVTEEGAERELRKMIKARGVSRAQLKEFVESHGIDFVQYREFIRLNLGRKQLIEQEIISKIKISDEEISSYYITNMGHGSGQVFEYRLAHIFFSSDSDKGGSSEAQARARSVYKMLKENKDVDFIEMASKYSEDPDFSNEGLLGSFKSGELQSSFEEAVKDLAEGDFSDIVKGHTGYHIIQLTKKTLVEDPNLRREKPRIREILMGRAFEKNFANWMKKKRGESFIKIN